jgi:hypothetical protein
MQIVKVSQSNEREQWLSMRVGVVTGTKAKEVAPPKRGGGVAQGIYALLAEKIAVEKDGEREIKRGLRLEDEALLLTQDKYKLDLDLDPGMWLSDDGKLGVSPDAAQVGDKPIYAAEAKCLDSKNHLQAIVNDWTSRKLAGYNPLGSLKISTADYGPQAIQYFVLNPYLQILYFTLYDDRVALENVVHYVIEIKREHVEEFIIGQELYERDALSKVDKMIEILKEIK